MERNIIYENINKLTGYFTHLNVFGFGKTNYHIRLASLFLHSCEQDLNDHLEPLHADLVGSQTDTRRQRNTDT